jgi:hypothetical protein
MAVLTFGATATIGSLRYAAGIAGIRITLAIGPGVGSARIMLPRDLRVDARADDDVQISLTGESGEEIDVFTGTVYAVSRALDQTTVICGDAAAALAAIRPGSTFEQQNASAVVTALTREAGVRAGSVDLDIDLPCYVADQGRTAWEHVTTLAGWGDAIAAVAGDGTVEVRPFPSPPADVALRYGREIAELSIAAMAPAADLIFAGNGPAGSSSDPRAQLQTTGTLPDGAPGPDANTVRVPAPALRIPAAAANASQAYAKHNGAARLRAACWLVPELRPGTAVEIADAPTPDSAGPWLLTRVIHQIGPGPAGRTSFEAINMHSTGGSDLLGQLAGALGSLL